MELARHNERAQSSLIAALTGRLLFNYLFNYLFNVRYLHMTSLSLRGMLGTPAVLGAVAIVVAGQLAFTCTPFVLFDSAPVPLADGAVVIGIGVLLMVILEIEKVLVRRFTSTPVGVAS